MDPGSPIDVLPALDCSSNTDSIPPSPTSHFSNHYYEPMPADESASPHSQLADQCLSQTSRFAHLSTPPHYHSPQNIFPSPQPSVSDDFDNYSYQRGSPACSSIRDSYDPSPVSPRTWSSPGPITFGSPIDRPLPDQQAAAHALRFCTPSTDDFPLSPQRDLSTRYRYQFGGSNPGLSPQGSPILSSLTAVTAMSPRSVSSPSGSHNLMKDSPSDDVLSLGMPPGHENGGVAAPRAVSAPRTDEPYAQLIYKAFMSRPSHAMTLQEMYQWFRENTDKAKSESKGWQNSIRHNLSMNAAFSKRERHIGTNADGDPKRCTEWYLESWAIQWGVQSTTRYRKAPNPGRSGTRARKSVGRVSLRGKKVSRRQYLADLDCEMFNATADCRKTRMTFRGSEPLGGRGGSGLGHGMRGDGAGHGFVPPILPGTQVSLLAALQPETGRDTGVSPITPDSVSNYTMALPNPALANGDASPRRVGGALINHHSPSVNETGYGTMDTSRYYMEDVMGEYSFRSRQVFGTDDELPVWRPGGL